MLGKANLARLPPDEMADCLERVRLPSYTSRPIADRKRLLEDLEQARLRGYAISSGFANEIVKFKNLIAFTTDLNMIRLPETANISLYSTMHAKHQSSRPKKPRSGGHNFRLAPDFNQTAAKGSAFLQRHRYGLSASAVLFICFFVMYIYTQHQTSWFIYWFDDWVFYADSSGSYDHMKGISFDGNMWRHPIYPLVVVPIVSGIKAVFGFGNREAAKVAVALLAALNVALFFTLLRSCFKEKITALLFSCLYGVLFSNLVFFSIPETYSLANLGILVFLLFIIRFRNGITNKGAVILGLIAGVGALINPPLGLLLFSLYILCWRRLAWMIGLKRCIGLEDFSGYFHSPARILDIMCIASGFVLRVLAGNESQHGFYPMS